MRYRVDHVTKVKYQSAASLARFNLRLEPIDWPGQQIEDFMLEIEPHSFDCQAREAPYPFHLTRMEIDEPFRTLTIHASFHVTNEDAMMLDLGAPDPTIADVARAAIASPTLDGWAPAHYLYPSLLLPGQAEIAEWAAPLLEADAPVVATGLALAERIYAEFKYESGSTTADTPVAEAFAMKRGVCQDFAHILIEAFRSVGLPAAYVSGYLRTTPPPGKPRLIGVDAMHAWVALWCGTQRGWVGLDPTNGCFAGSGHVVTGMGRDYADVSPIDGIFVGGGKQELKSAVDVMPLED